MSDMDFSKDTYAHFNLHSSSKKYDFDIAKTSSALTLSTGQSQGKLKLAVCVSRVRVKNISGVDIMYIDLIVLL